MSDYLDFVTLSQMERVRQDRKIFCTQLALFLFNLTWFSVDLFLVIKDPTTFLYMGVGAMFINVVWCFAFCIDFGVDYRNSKKYLHDLLNMQQKDLIKLDKNVIKMR